MLLRILVTFGLCALFGSEASSAAAVRAEKSHAGVVVTVGAGKLVMSDAEGNNEHAHLIPERVTVTIDGVSAKLIELVKGDSVVVTVGDDGEVVAVVAKRTKK